MELCLPFFCLSTLSVEKKFDPKIGSHAAILELGWSLTTGRPPSGGLYLEEVFTVCGGAGGRTPLGIGTLIVARGIALSYAIVVTRFSMYAHLSVP